MHMCVCMCICTCMPICLRVRGLQANMHRNMLSVHIIFENMYNNIMTFHNAVWLQIVEKSFVMLHEDLLILVQIKFFIYLLWNIALCINTKKKPPRYLAFMELDRCRIIEYLDYQTVPVLTQVLTGNFFVTAPIRGCTTYQRSIPYGYLLYQLV